MPNIEIPRWLNTSTNHENNHQFHVFVDASTVALAAVAYLRIQKQDEIFQTSFLLGKRKAAPIKEISVPKLELEAAVLRTRLRTLIQTEMTLRFEKVYLWTDSRVVFHWINSTKEQNRFVSNRLEKTKKQLKLMSGIMSQLILIQPTMERVALYFPLKLSQSNVFSSIINALKRTQKLDAKGKWRNLNPVIDENGLLRSSGRLLFAPTENEIEKCPIILDAKENLARLCLEHAHRIFAHQITEPAKAFVQQRYYVIGL